jgi:hypothetical protein
MSSFQELWWKHYFTSFSKFDPFLRKKKKKTQKDNNNKTIKNVEGISWDYLKKIECWKEYYISLCPGVQFCVYNNIMVM